MDAATLGLILQAAGLAVSIAIYRQGRKRSSKGRHRRKRR